MGASAFQSPKARCEGAVRDVRRTFEVTTRSKARARSLIRMLKLAVRPKHAELLYRSGAVDICVQVLEQESKGSPMRELALVALLCLSLDVTVKHDVIAAGKSNIVGVVTRVLRQERPSTSIKYAAVAVVHSLSRDASNIEALFRDEDLVDTIMEAIAYESEGSPLRKLACEVVCTLSELKSRQMLLYRSFSEIASRLLIGEIGTGSPVLETALQILCNLASNDGNKEALLKERVVIECAVKALQMKTIRPDSKTKLASIGIFYHIAMGSAELAARIANLPRIIQACIDSIELKPPPIDPCSLTAIKLLHVLSTFQESRRAILETRHLVDPLFFHCGSNVYARMAYVNVIGAFDEEDEADPESHGLLLGCEDMDDQVLELLARWCFMTREGLSGEGEDWEASEAGADAADYAGLTGLAPLLTISVLIRRSYHMERLRSRLGPLILAGLDKALKCNDVATVSFALACLRSLITSTAGGLQQDSVLELLGRVQEKVHPSWRPVRVDAERLVSRMSTNGTTTSRLKPVVEMLEKVLNDDQRGFTRSLDVPLTSLSYSLDLASKDEKVLTGKKLITLLPRALKKAVHDDDLLSAKCAMELFRKVIAEDWEDRDWDKEKTDVSTAVNHVLLESHWSEQL